MFTEYWVKIKIANPNLDDADAKMTISVANFNKQLKKAYIAGMEEGRVKGRVEGRVEGERVAIKRAKAAKDFEKIKQPDSKSYDSTMDLFSGIFGDNLRGKK